MPRIKQEELEEISLYSIRSPSGPHRGLIVTSFASLIVLVHSIYFTKFGVDTSKIQDELVFAFPIKKTNHSVPSISYCIRYLQNSALLHSIGWVRSAAGN